MPKVSLIWEDALSGLCLLLVVALCLPVLSLEPVRKPVLVAPAAPGAHHEASSLLLPLQCDAWIVQSGDGIKEPRARCYHFPSRKSQ